MSNMTCPDRQTHFFYLPPESGGFRLCYDLYGKAGATPPILAVHGLTRNRHDFAALGKKLAEAGRQVIAPDMIGRGDSDWLTNPADYAYPTYISHMQHFMAAQNISVVDWIGTSMGGLMGMMLAALPESPIRRLVLNDVGAVLPKTALERIARYVGQAPAFPTLEAAESYLRQIHAPFGVLTDSQWQSMAETGTCQTATGYHLAYDPLIAEAFNQDFEEDVSLWDIWEAISCPVLLLRGAESDLLSAELAQEMRQRYRGTDFRRIDFADCGHAPYLHTKAQQAPILAFLADGTA